MSKTSVESVLVKEFSECKANNILVCKDILLLKNFLNEKQCENIIKAVDESSIEPLSHKHMGRFCSRTILDSKDLAQLVWERLKPQLTIPYQELIDEFGNTWSVSHVNERFRLCAYKKGNLFSKHYDGFWEPAYDEKSFATLMIYLNTVDDNTGGATRFLDFGIHIKPRAGNAIVFFVDDLLHDGEEIKSKENKDNNNNKFEKYILRTDIMYKCTKFKDKTLSKKIYELKKQVEILENEGKDEEAIKLIEKYMELEVSLK